jgi:biopolymer transport protein ExbB/TolQ
MDIQERLTAFAMLGAGWVMWLLVGFSILCLAIILERTYFFFQTRDDLGKLSDSLLAKLRAGDIDGARTAMKASPSTEALVALAGLDSVDDGHASAGTRMAKETQLARIAMERNLAFLGTVGNNTPFIGLLGTVIGVIRSFHELNESGGAVSAGLMSEVGEALVATAIGLIVALPAVAAFNFFQRIIKTRVSRGEALGKEVLAFLESTRTPAPSKAPAAKSTPSKGTPAKGKLADEDEDDDDVAPAPAE